MIKTLQPHDVDPALLKSKRQKTENDHISSARNSSNRSVTPVSSAPYAVEMSSSALVGRQTPNKTPQNNVRKRQNNNNPAIVHLISPIPLSVQVGITQFNFIKFVKLF